MLLSQDSLLIFLKNDIDYITEQARWEGEEGEEDEGEGGGGRRGEENEGEEEEKEAEKWSLSLSLSLSLSFSLFSLSLSLSLSIPLSSPLPLPLSLSLSFSPSLSHRSYCSKLTTLVLLDTHYSEKVSRLYSNQPRQLSVPISCHSRFNRSHKCAKPATVVFKVRV